MARLKSYYTADEITNNLYTTGSQFMTEDNAEYIGLYHAYSTGERYTNATWNSKLSKRLVPYTKFDTTNEQYQLLKPGIVLNYETPSASSVVIKKMDIDNGYVNRYFLQKINETKILEVSQITYDKWASNVIDKKLHNAATLQWSITGNIEDVTINGILSIGVISKNKKAVEEASQTIPDLALILTNFTQFYTDVNYVVPVDINRLDS